MGERRNLMLGLVAAAVLLIVVAFFLLTRGGSQQTAETLPSPPAAGESSEQGVEVQTEPEAGTQPGSAVIVTSNRDPFRPLVEPTTQTSTDETSDDQTSSSNPAGKSSQKKSQSTDTRQTTPKEPKLEESKTKQDKTTDDQGSKGKAPKPIGGTEKDDDTEASGTDVRVVDVRESIAVVRVNDSRTTLYVGVPDASGVTFTSSLSGTCGLFSIAGSEELLTICEGETRQL